ncbi:SARP family transcriptional regulator [Phytohabitans aurantiacus]|uniref:SARP family transcriptional regulator n=1 Tax=Phytohabitans aurantiacus TaxID=3016789 RepID=A0ABQ5R5Z0_9ACTN|nr:SARP family transcriptional regulator [Phytohabitans aurantiacus]
MDGVIALRIQVLGPLRAWRGEEPVELGRVGQRAVLGLLALAGGQPLSRAELVDALWGDAPPPSAANVIQTSVKHLRRLLEPDRPPRTPSAILPAVGDGYALRLPAESVDLVRFRHLVSTATGAQQAGDQRRAAELLGEALRLWHGGPLADITMLAGHPKLVALAEERRAIVGRYGELMIATGAAGEALPALEEVAAEQPLDEAAQARLIRGYRAAGRRAQAFVAYDRIGHRLADELGVDPGPDLVAAHASLLAEDEQPSGAGTPRVAAQYPVPSQLPADVASFTGRDSHLRQLDDLLAGMTTGRPRAVVISAVSGTAGVGKTALAVHFAHRVRHRFPDGQLYVNLRGFDPSGSVMSAAEAVRGFLDAFGVPAERIPASLHAQAALYRSLIADRRVLVLLDNARDAEQVRPLLPGTPGCLVLVTSRNQLTSLVATDGAHPVTLDLLSSTEAKALLARRLGADRVAAEPDAVDEIITMCARLPLAVAIVAARATTHPGFPLTALADQLRAAGGLDALTADDPTSDVRTVFSWSYHALTAPAAMLFRLLGLHPGADITAPAAASLAGVPTAQVRQPLAELVGAHLITERSPGRYVRHDLLRSYATELLHARDTQQSRRAALHRLLDHWVHTAHAADRLLDPHREQIALAPPQPGVAQEALVHHEQALAWLTNEHPALLAGVEAAAAEGFDTHTWQLAWAMTTLLERGGHWHDLAAVQHAALRAGERLDDQRVRAHAHRRLAHFHIWFGRDEAETHLLRALDLYRDLGDGCGQARTHLNLAVICERRGEHHAALRHAEQAAGMFQHAGDRSGQADACNAVGWYQAHIGSPQDALAHCQEALRLYQSAGDEKGESHAWDSLGFIYNLLGRQQEAIRCYRRALALRRKVGYRYFEARALHSLGDIQRAVGEVDSARVAWQEALVILDAFGHPEANQVRAKLHTVGAMSAG